MYLDFFCLYCLFEQAYTNSVSVTRNSRQKKENLPNNTRANFVLD